MVRPLPLLLVAVVLLSVAGVAAADVRGNPTLSVYLPDNRVEPGATTTLELSLQNEGNVEEGGTDEQEARVTTARDVRVRLGAGAAPLEVETSTQPVGNVPEGVAGPVSFVVTVDEAATAGTYALPVTVDYTYTSEIDTDTPGEPEYRTRSATLETTVDVVVEERARFEVDGATADVAVGATGDVTVRLRHVGNEAARDAAVTLDARDPALTFGEANSATTFVGDWAPGEVRSVTVSARVAAGADARPLPVAVTVEYVDADGATRTSDPLTAGVAPRAEQSFAVDRVESTLAVGDEGTLRGRLTNTGESTVRNVVVVFGTDTENVVPVETEYAVGDLAPGASATFAFDAEISDAADAGPRQLSLTVRYRDAGDDVRRSDPLDVRVDVGERRDVFDVEPLDATFAPGSSGVLELRVTNAGEEPVADVSAKLFTDDPLSSADDEAFVDALAPGESVVVRFELSAAGDALGKDYPVSVDFQYDDAEGDTRLSNTYDVPVTVVERTGGAGLDPLVVGGAVVGLLVLVGAVVAIRRR